MVGNDFVKFSPTFKKFTSYRNIATCFPSQDLFDDIASPKNYPVLQQMENATSQIDHSQPQKWRPYQYADRDSLLVFDQLNWRAGRFSRGLQYGVWYGALEEETSQREILYHRIREVRDLIKNPKITSSVFIFERVMLKANCKTRRCVDLRKIKSLQEKLILDDYDFCQDLGEQAAREQMDAFLTPSARAPGGTCTPIFNPKVILKDEKIYFFDLTIDRNFDAQIKKNSKLDVPEVWKT